MRADVEQAAHVGRAPVHVHGHDGSRPRRDRGLRSRSLEASRRDVHVREHGHGADLHHRERRRDEAIGGDDDLVARAHARRSEGDGQRARSAVGEQTMLRPDEARELLLERQRLGRKRAGEDAAIEHTRDRPPFVVADDRPDAVCFSGEDRRRPEEGERGHGVGSACALSPLVCTCGLVA